MAGGGSAIRAGRAFVELFADSNQLYRALNAAEKRVKEFGKYLGAVGVGIAGAGAAMLTPITKLFTDAVNKGADVEKMAKRFGSTAEEISTLQGAFAQAGAEAGDFNGVMEKLAEKISHAADTNGYLMDSLRSLGTARDFMGKGVTEQFDLIADRIAAIANPLDRLRAASELGLSPAMQRALEGGSAAFKKFREEAIKNGDAMSGEQTKQALEIQKEYNRVLLAGKSTLLEVGKALLPTGASFTSVGDTIRKTLEDVREWIRNNKQIIVGVTAGAAALIAGGTAIAAFGGAVAIAAPIIGGLVIAIKAAVAVVGAILSPIGLAIAAVAAVGVGIGYLVSRTEAGKAAFADLKNAVGDAVNFIKGSWQGVSDALTAGNWTLAWKIVLKSAEVAWDTFVLKLQMVWLGFNVVVVDAWEDTTGAIAKAFVAVGAEIEKIIGSVINTIVEKFNAVAGAIDSSLKISLPGRSDAEIDKEKKETLAAIDEITKAEKARRLKDRLAGVSGAKADLDAAKKELEDLKKEAADEAGKRYGGLFNRIVALAKNKKKDESGELPNVTQLFANQKGIFGGNAAQQLGYGDQTAQRQLDAQVKLVSQGEKQNGLLASIAEAVSSGGSWT